MEKIFSVKNKVALITGASSGIGRHLATTLAKYGADVILVGRNISRLKQTEEACRQFDVKTLALAADIKTNSAVNDLIAESKKNFAKVDILINAAGIAMRTPSLDLSEQQWNDVMDTNLKGTFLVTQALAKWMIATKTPGKIINISSSAAFHLTPTRAAYSASKVAVENITRSLALNLVAHNIRVNCIAPGFFVTELTRDYIQTDLGKAEVNSVPMQRAANVSELEGALLLLASDASSYMTGTVLHIDGGYAIEKS